MMVPLEENPLYSTNCVLYDRILKGNFKVAMDLGANEGGYAISLSRWFPEVHAYEPVPDMFDKLRKRSTKCHGLFPHKMGVSDKLGVVTGLNVYSSWMLCESSSRTDRALDYVGKPDFDMITTTVDHENLGPDFIKVDVDGYEPAVVAGAIKTLTEFKPSMYFELSNLAEHHGFSVKRMLNCLYEIGYKAWSVDGSFCCPSVDEMIRLFPYDSSFDVMFIHPDGKFKPT